MTFKQSWNIISEYVHNNAVNKGWWENKDYDYRPEFIALLHSEVSEALEGIRKGNPPDEHIPEFSTLEAELADVIIRIMDFSYHEKLNIVDALDAKIQYNKNRPYKHGGKEF